MAGYPCVYHDGEADGVHIHQTLGVPGVVSVCDDCQPVYLITTLAGVLSVPAGELYDVVRSYQIATQEAGGQPPTAGEAPAAEMPAGPHPAAVLVDGSVTHWDWCSCDAPGPHGTPGGPLSPEVLAELREEQCPYCGHQYRCTSTDLAARIDEHLASCPGPPEAADEGSQE